MPLINIIRDRHGLIVNPAALAAVEYDEYDGGVYSVKFYLIGHREPLVVVAHTLEELNEILEAI